MSKSAIPKLVQRILSRFPTERIGMLRKAGWSDKEIAGSVIMASVPKDKRASLVKALAEPGISTGDILSYLADGITPEEVADELFDGIDDVYSEAERAEGLDYIRTAYRILSQAICAYFGTSTKIPDTVKKGGRGLAAKTRALRHSIQAAFDEADKPVTVRQMFYMLTVRGAVEKEESGYRKAQRQLLAMRREDVISYNWISDNTRWMRKPITYKRRL